LGLDVQASLWGPPDVLILNLSLSGVLIDTAANLVVGETIQIELPEAGACPARIVWTEGNFFGCEFISPVSKAAVSAALLLAPVDRPGSAGTLADIADAYLGNEQDRWDLTPASQSRGAYVAVMASLVAALVMVAMFIYALLAFPFST
jgi:hypothetical protein